MAVVTPFVLSRFPLQDDSRRTARAGGEGRPRRAARGLALAGAAAAALAAAAGSAGCAKIELRLAMNRGVSFFKAHEYEKAVTSFREAIAIDPRYSEAYLDLGLTYMEVYEPGSTHEKDLEYAEGAIEAFKRYVELEPDSEKGKEYLINICTLSQRLPDAIEFFMRDYEKNPRDIEGVRYMAALYHRAGDAEKAIEWYQKAADLDPTNPEAHYSVAVSCWGRSYNAIDLSYERRMEIVDLGLAEMEKALALRPEYYEAISYLSLLYREKAKYDISPAATVTWRQKADELLAKAMELRNKSLAAQAAAAAAAQGDAAPASQAPAAGRTNTP